MPYCGLDGQPFKTFKDLKMCRVVKNKRLQVKKLKDTIQQYKSRNRLNLGKYVKKKIANSSNCSTKLALTKIISRL